MSDFSSGSYVNDATAEEGLLETVMSWRTPGNGYAQVSNPDTCDKLLTLYDPFDFTIDWRLKGVRVKRTSPRDPCRSKNKWKCWFDYVHVSYPYYQFKKKTLSVRHWRLILRAGKKVSSAASGENVSHEEVALRLKWLEKALSPHKICGPLSYRPPERQNDCTHYTSIREVGAHPGPGIIKTDYVSPDWPYGGGGSFIDLASQNYAHRAWEPPGNATFFVGESNSYQYTDPTSNYVNLLTQGLITDPMSRLFDPDSISTLTAMLWPDSGDFKEIGAQPLIDIAEAVSDGSIIGAPPNPAEAHDKMLRNAISDENLKAARNVVDFSANLWLWTTLVITPVISSAMALSASVRANDDAIEAFQKKADEGKWIKGKSLRVYNGLKDCVDIDPEHSESWSTDSVWSGETTRSSSVNYSLDVHKLEGNAMFVFLLDRDAGFQMNTSGVRLGHFFKRLSTDLSSITWNLLPLSFVFDWFSSEFTGTLNLLDKIYMPVSDWKLTVSHNVTAYLSITGYSMLRETSAVKWRWQDGFWGAPGKWVIDDNHVLLDHCPETFYTGTSTLYKYEPEQQHFGEKKTDITELFKYYHRQVYNKPVRRTDFTWGDSTFGLPCFNNIHSDPLDMGKSVTLGALLWGLT